MWLFKNHHTNSLLKCRIVQLRALSFSLESGFEYQCSPGNPYYRSHCRQLLIISSSFFQLSCLLVCESHDMLLNMPILHGQKKKNICLPKSDQRFSEKTMSNLTSSCCWCRDNEGKYMLVVSNDSRAIQVGGATYWLKWTKLWHKPLLLWAPQWRKLWIVGWWQLLHNIIEKTKLVDTDTRLEGIDCLHVIIIWSQSDGVFLR